jgi:hypothetical protein
MKVEGFKDYVGMSGYKQKMKVKGFKGPSIFCYLLR